MFLARVIDYLYPPSCHLCRAPLDRGRYLCPDCQGELPRVTPPFCQQCGLPYDGNLGGEFTCPNCRERKFSFDFARAALLARDGARELVHAFKYQRRIHLHRDLAALTAEALLDPRLAGEAAWTLVPVPLHWKRQQWRYFNQAHEIARDVVLTMVRSETHAPEPPYLLRVYQPFTAMLREGQARGEVRDDVSADFLAEMVVGMLNATVTGWLADPAYPVEKQIVQAAEFSWDAIRTNADSAPRSQKKKTGAIP